MDNKYKKYPEKSIIESRFYNVGAGRFAHPNWTNIDYDFNSDWYESHKGNRHIQHDLSQCQPLKIDSDVVEAVYTSHVIEHITDEAAQVLFNEVYRILKPGGIFRITTPDADLMRIAYLNKDRSFYYWADRYSRPEDMVRLHYKIKLSEASHCQLLLTHIATASTDVHADPIDEPITDEQFESMVDSLGFFEALDECCKLCPSDKQNKYPGNHINWWTEKKIFNMLTESGFTDIYKSGYKQSLCPPMREDRLFDSRVPEISLYMECKK